MRYLVIDGYNAISKIKIFDDKKDISLEASRNHFIKTLVGFSEKKHMFDRIIVVFDGKKDNVGMTRYSYGKVDTLFTANNKDADSAIVWILKIASHSDRITVSSDDNFIRNHARVFRASIMPIRELENTIILKKHITRCKIEEKDMEKDRIKEITDELKKHWGIE